MANMQVYLLGDKYFSIGNILVSALSRLLEKEILKARASEPLSRALIGPSVYIIFSTL